MGKLKRFVKVFLEILTVFEKSFEEKHFHSRNLKYYFATFFLQYSTPKKTAILIFKLKNRQWNRFLLIKFKINEIIHFFNRQ